MIFARTVATTVGHVWDSAFVTSTADDVKRALDELSDEADAVNLARFFKTGPGNTGRATSSSVCGFPGRAAWFVLTPIWTFRR